MGAGCPAVSLSTATQEPRGWIERNSAQCGSHPSIHEAVYGTDREINRAEALAALLGLSWAAGDELLDLHITLWTDNAKVFNALGEARAFVAIPRPASAVPLNDAPLAWQHLGGRYGGSRVCRIPRTGQAGRSWKPFIELGPRFSCLLMLLRSVSLKFQEGGWPRLVFLQFLP